MVSTPAAYALIQVCSRYCVFVNMQKQLEVERQEEEKWRDVPEWKKALIQEREKRREEDNVRV